MSKFKVGDRVRTNRDASGYHAGCLGTVGQLMSDDEIFLYIRDKDNKDKGHWFVTKTAYIKHYNPTLPCAAHDLETEFNESKALLLDELNELTDMLQNNGYSTNHITITEALTILNIILKK